MVLDVAYPENMDYCGGMEAGPDIITASHICDVLGRRQIADRIGVGLTAVSNASVEGVFPASWFEELRQMCSDAKIECPICLFKWKRAATEKGAA